jgi:ribosomal protein S6--L-glutamate ligase
LGTKKSSRDVINAFKSLNANILVQEFIKEANGRHSLFCNRQKVVAHSEREDGKFRANIHLGGTATVIKATMEEAYCD